MRVQDWQPQTRKWLQLKAATEITVKNISNTQVYLFRLLFILFIFKVTMINIEDIWDRIVKDNGHQPF